MQDIKFTIYNGNTVGLSLIFLSKQINIYYFYVNDSINFLAMKSVFEVDGFSTNVFKFLSGKSSIEALFGVRQADIYLCLRSPIIENILFILKDNSYLEYPGKVLLNHEEKNKSLTFIILVGKKSFVNMKIFISLHHIEEKKKFAFNGIIFDKTFNLTYAQDNKSLIGDIIVNCLNVPIIDVKLQYRTECNGTRQWTKSIEMLVSKLISVPKKYLINPKIVIHQDEEDKDIVTYQFSFDNGLRDHKYFLNLNCSISFQRPQFFSMVTKSSINSFIYMNTLSYAHTGKTEILLENRRLAVAFKWDGVEKNGSAEAIPLESFELKGYIEDNLVEIDLNKNKFVGSIMNNGNETKIMAELYLTELDRNDSMLIVINYSPIFILSFTHTLFPNPCTLELRVDLSDTYLETVLSVLHNDYEHQAIINIHLAKSPKYAELIYLDNWKQTHEVSVYVDESKDEITLKGKMNSPALDENFLFITIGHNNDKCDFNMNDDLIFKAFKDDNQVWIDLYFGNDYKLNFKHENNVELSILSPILSGNIFFKLSQIFYNSLFKVDLIHSGVNHFYVAVNLDNLLDVSVRSGENNIFDLSFELKNDNETLDFHINLDVYKESNNLIMKHNYKPNQFGIKFVWYSSYFPQSNTEIVFGLRNEYNTYCEFYFNKNEEKLLGGSAGFDNQSKLINVTFEAPFFSQMDKATVSGIFVVSKFKVDVNLTATLSTDKAVISEVNIHCIKNYDILSSGIVINSEVKGLDKTMLIFWIPRQLSTDMKVRLFFQLASKQPYEIGFTFSLSDNKILASAITQWREFITSLEFILATTPFYKYMMETNVQYMDQKVQFGVWSNPKYPITDYIYYIEVDNLRFMELSHSFIITPHHYKTKLVLNTLFKGHEKYGVELEFKSFENSKFGKIIKVLGSVPQFGRDLGVDFQFTYENLFNYTVLAQMKIPYNNTVKIARLFSFHHIQPNLSFSFVNHSFEFSGFGNIGMEIEVSGKSPFILQTGTALIASRFVVHNDVYSFYTKTNINSDKIGFEIIVETPLEFLRNGMVHIYIVQEVFASELIVSYNSEKVFNINTMKDNMNTKSVYVYTKSRSLEVKYFYKDQFGVLGYFCWDAAHKNLSQIGFKFLTVKSEGSYDIDIEIILPSVIIPKMAIKKKHDIDNENILNLMQIVVPRLWLEFRLLKSRRSINNKETEIDLRWSVSESSFKKIGLLFNSNTEHEDTVHCFALQHFALKHDISVTLYTKKSLYAVNIQYSPLKESHITLEFGYWFENQTSGVKLLALHPQSNTMIFGVANITSTVDYKQAGMALSYLSDLELNTVKYVEIYGRKSNKNPQIVIGLASNGNDIIIGSSLQMKNSSMQGLTVEVKANLKDPLKVTIYYDRGIEVGMSYGMSRSYRMYAGMPSSNEITAQISHTLYGDHDVDMLARLRLNTSKILWGKFQIPTYFQVALGCYNNILAEYSDIFYISEAMGDGFQEFIREDFSHIAILILKSMASTSDILLSQTMRELVALRDGIEALGNIAVKAYEQDDLYIKSVASLLTSLGNRMYVSISYAAEISASLVEGVTGPAWSLVVRVFQVMGSLLSHWPSFASEIGITGFNPLEDLQQMIQWYQKLRISILRHASDGLLMARAHVDHALRDSADWLAYVEVTINLQAQSIADTIQQQLRRICDCWDTVIIGITHLGKTVSDMVYIVCSGVLDIKEVQSAVEAIAYWADTAYDWICNFHIHFYEALKQIANFYNSVLQLVVDDLSRHFEPYEANLKRAVMFVEGWYHQLSQIPLVKNIQEIVNSAYHKAQWFWNYTKLNEKLNNFLIETLQQVISSLSKWDEHFNHEGLYSKSEYKYIAENNTLLFTQELPFEWNAFNELPHDLNTEVFEGRGYIAHNTQSFSMLQETLKSFWERSIKVSSSLFPSFTATALFSPHNYITFDNTVYYLEGSCKSYLLAGDLLYNSFSLVAVYHNQDQRDIVLFVNDLELTIKNNLEVYKNGSLVDLPLKLSGSYQISLERKVNSVQVNSKKGFSLECSEFLNMCKFELSAWYSDKSAGLLGTPNYEPTDDLTGIDRQRTTSDIKQFADMWSLSSDTCDTIVKSLYSHPNDSKCQEVFFSDVSPLSPCFSELDPLVFQTMCNRPSAEDNICASVFTYIAKCAEAGIPLEIPDVCNNNAWLEEKQLLQSYSDFVEVAAEMSADVVFVVEQKQCANKPSEISHSVNNLASGLGAHNLSDIKYNLVTFSAAGVHIHTFNGSLWTTDSSQLITCILGLEHMYGSVTVESQYLTALQTAASLPFRPAASKIMVLLHCSSCPQIDPSQPLLQQFLLNDIVLHVVQEGPLIHKAGNRGNKLLGFDSLGAYSDARSNHAATPSLSLLINLSVAQDLCTPLALATNGTVFTLSNIGRRSKVWATRVGVGALPATPRKLCDSVIGDDHVPVWRCHSDTPKLYETLPLGEDFYAVANKDYEELEK